MLNKQLKKAIIFILILIPLFFSAAQPVKSLLEVEFFFNTPISNNDYYFSLLNEYYTQDKYYRYLYDGILEIIKFINLKLEMYSEEYSVGSHEMYKQQIRATIDAEIALKLVPYVRAVNLIKTDKGSVLLLKVSKVNMNKIWKEFHSSTLPGYAIDINNQTLNGVPNWFIELPKQNGYIFGVGSYTDASTLQNNIKNADYQARLEIVKTLKLKIKGELKNFNQNNFELLSFFNQQTSSAYLGGIFILKRYYNPETNAVFSLAALQIDK